MTQNPTIRCPKHGDEPVTLVCQHIAATLVTRRPVGFFWSRDGEQGYPDAWCSECQERHERCGRELKGEALEDLDAKPLCAFCYLEARTLCLGR